MPTLKRHRYFDGVYIWRRGRRGLVEAIGSAIKAGHWVKRTPLTRRFLPIHSTAVSIPEAAQTAYAHLDGQYAKKPNALQQNYFAKTARDPMVMAARVGEPKQLSHPVKFCEKGDRPLEFVPTRQWFIKILEHKEAPARTGCED